HIIEMGPGAGINGGQVIYEGEGDGRLPNTPIKINQNPRTATGHFTIENANHNNLQNIHVTIPKHVLVAVCGVSGSGKSSLMLEAFLAKYPDAITAGQGRIGTS